MKDKEYDKDISLALQALKRAAAKVAAEARRNGYKIPIWKDGHIEHLIPEAETTTADAD